MSAFVLDAFITLRWFFDAGSHPHADSILQGLASSTTAAIVPAIWLYEISAVLARAENDGITSPWQVENFFMTLEALPIRHEPAGATRIFERVHRVATTHRLTTYDAAYFETAQRLQLPLASLDAELIAVCRKTGHPIV